MYCTLLNKNNLHDCHTEEECVVHLLNKLRDERLENIIELSLLAIEIVTEKRIKDAIHQDYSVFKRIISTHPEALDSSIVDSFIDVASSLLQKRIVSGATAIDLEIENSFCTINRVLAGFSLRFGLDGIFRCKFENGTLVLPHAGVCVYSNIGTPTFNLHISNRRMWSDLQESITDQPQSELLQSLQIPSVSFFDREIFINREDPVFVKWNEDQPFNLAPRSELESREVASRWIRRLSSAHMLFQRFWPEMGRNISRTIADIVPLKSPEAEGESLSCSSSGHVGAIICSLVPSEAYGEMLVHEYAHNLLNIAMRFESMLEPRAFTENNYYSPFRSDPRPISGVLHAFHSLVHIAEYYYRLGHEARYAGLFFEIFTSSVIKARICSQVVRSSRLLTENGRCLVTAMDERINQLTISSMWCPTSEIFNAHNIHLQSADRALFDFSWLGERTLHDIVMTDSDSALLDLPNHKPIGDSQLHREVDVASAQDADQLDFSDEPSQSPVVFKGLRIFEEDFLTPSNMQEKFGTELITQIAMSKHKGYANTPKLQVSLMDFLSTSKTKTSENDDGFYLGVQPINSWPGVTDAVKVHDILEKLFLDNNDLLLFRNRAETFVLLHQDSANNLHFNLWGRKTFYLSHPDQTPMLYEGHDGYRRGFSPINPFDIDFSLNRYPQFIDAKGTYVTLEAGDCLFIPKNWWHAVKYHEDCAAVTCWDRYSP
jgi:HEXXH motif-containing protein